MRTCNTCGKIHTHIPTTAKYHTDDGELTGWYFDCSCHSTLFIPQALAMRQCPTCLNPGLTLDLAIHENEILFDQHCKFCNSLHMSRFRQDAFKTVWDAFSEKFPLMIGDHNETKK